MTPSHRAALTGARHRQRARPLAVNLSSSTNPTLSQHLQASGFGVVSSSRDLQTGGFEMRHDAIMRLIRLDLEWDPQLGDVVNLDDGRVYRIAEVRDVPTEPEVGYGLGAVSA